MDFYYLSGSPFSWKVWLALEHKKLAYGLKILSADSGDLKTAEFLALNPRGKVPVLVDDGFVLSESAAIVEYLEERYSTQGPRLWPADERARACARRLSMEGDSYIYPHVRKLVVELLMRKEGTPDQAQIAEAKINLQRELSGLESGISSNFLAGPETTAADFAIYPFLAVLRRLAQRKPKQHLAEIIPEGVAVWMGRVEALPLFARTKPPHWSTS